MQLIIKGRQMEITPRVRQHIEQKVQRLARFVGEDARVEVTVSEEQTRSARDHFSVQIALSGMSHPIRSEVSGVNINAALDRVLAKVTTQVSRQKGRQTASRRLHTSPVQILALSRTGTLSSLEDERTGQHESLEVSIAGERNEEIWTQITEIRRIATKPMSDQEVIAQIEAQGLSFYPFFNAETNSVNVMYRLENGSYGLLIPALEQVAD